MSDVMSRALAERVRGLPPPEPLPIDAVSDEILDGVRVALLAGETHYTDRPGILELRELVAAALGRTPDEVIITSGEKEARFVTRLALGDVPESVVFGSWSDRPALSSFLVGYVSAPLDLARKIRSLKQALSICTAAPSQRAALITLSR